MHPSNLITVSAGRYIDGTIEKHPDLVEALFKSCLRYASQYGDHRCSSGWREAFWTKVSANFKERTGYLDECMPNLINFERIAKGLVEARKQVMGYFESENAWKVAHGLIKKWIEFLDHYNTNRESIKVETIAISSTSTDAEKQEKQVMENISKHESLLKVVLARSQQINQVKIFNHESVLEKILAEQGQYNSLLKTKLLDRQNSALKVAANARSQVIDKNPDFQFHLFNACWDNRKQWGPPRNEWVKPSSRTSSGWKTTWWNAVHKSISREARSFMKTLPSATTLEKTADRLLSKRLSEYLIPGARDNRPREVESIDRWIEFIKNWNEDQANDMEDYRKLKEKQTDIEKDKNLSEILAKVLYEATIANKFGGPRGNYLFWKHIRLLFQHQTQWSSDSHPPWNEFKEIAFRMDAFRKKEYALDMVPIIDVDDSDSLPSVDSWRLALRTHDEKAKNSSKRKQTIKDRRERQATRLSRRMEFHRLNQECCNLN